MLKKLGIIVAIAAGIHSPLYATEGHGVKPKPPIELPPAQPALKAKGNGGFWIDQSIDPWRGKDKRQHVAASAFIGLGAAAVVQQGVWVPFGLCMLPGAALEAKQGISRGAASWRDLVADGLGCGLGIATGRGIQVLFRSDGTSASAVAAMRF